jgi:hypothetical protein
LPALPKSLSQPLVLSKGPSQIFCPDGLGAVRDGSPLLAGEEVLGCQSHYHHLGQLFESSGYLQYLPRCSGVLCRPPGRVLVPSADNA